jgi:hypothetical protein
MDVSLNNILNVLTMTHYSFLCFDFCYILEICVIFAYNKLHTTKAFKCLQLEEV